MKTLISKTNLILTISIILSSYILASATIFSYSEKSNIKNMPCISSSINANYENAIAVNYNLGKENYISDIPFNTFNVAAEYINLEAVVQDFNMKEESYIDDIPFNTNKIVRLNHPSQ